MAKKTATDAAKARLTTPVPRVAGLNDDDLLSTGCTLLNMAFSGRHNGGVPKGMYLYFVGDSSSGKTWFSMNLFAEAALRKDFNQYRFVFDNAENGALMDVERFFGKKVLERLEPPARDAKTKEPIYSETAQEFYYNVEINCRKPCIYVLDSMDAINDDADEAKFAAELKRYETGKGEVPGSMGMAKAKTNSRNINRTVQSLRDTGSILVVLSQTRDKVGGQFPGQKSRGGGKALRFYAHLEMWTSVRGPIKSPNKGYKHHEVGATIGIDVQKNRVSGWEGKIEVPFLKRHGIDDIGSCVDYLLDEGHWKAPKKKANEEKRAEEDDGDDDRPKQFEAPEFEFTGSREKLIVQIQEAGEEDELRRLVASVWRDIEAGAAPERKARYT